MFGLLLAKLVNQLLGASNGDVAKGIGISLVLHFIVPFWFLGFPSLDYVVIIAHLEAFVKCFF